MAGPNTETTARLVTRPTLAAILKIDRARQRWKMREQGCGKQSNRREVVRYRGEGATWKAKGINKEKRIEEIMIGEEGEHLAWRLGWIIEFCQADMTWVSKQDMYISV